MSCQSGPEPAYLVVFPKDLYLPQHTSPMPPTSDFTSCAMAL
ncbi:unnamed protein product [Staurois parvus]|uniref:Uncharacterized protein n=1 Tax=Staurois parvus TaxID=386267 RepID=A0ABN9DNK5_9NEOB|nr:unnamed protein product [Staurois parvus]